MDYRADYSLGRWIYSLIGDANHGIRLYMVRWLVLSMVCGCTY